MEAVVGSYAARQLGWKIGTTFKPYHGLAFDPEGSSTKNSTPSSASLNRPTRRSTASSGFPLEGVQTMSGHNPLAATELSAVLIQLRAPTAGLMLDMMINKQGNRLTFAYPIGAIVAELFNKISWVDKVLTLLAWLVAVVASGSVLVSIYNSMSARQRDIAILRALGARRRTIFGAVMGEAAVIGALGALAGFAVFVALATFVASIIQAQTGVVLEPMKWNPVFCWGPTVFVGLCALGGIGARPQGLSGAGGGDHYSCVIVPVRDHPPLFIPDVGWKSQGTEATRSPAVPSSASLVNEAMCRIMERGTA